MQVTSANYKEILAQNEMIGRYCQVQPQIEWDVASGPNAIQYSPASSREYFPTAALQKKECERYIKEQEEKKYASPGELTARRWENWPNYHVSCPDMLRAVKHIVKKDGAKFELTLSPAVVHVSLSKTDAIRSFRKSPHPGEDDLTDQMYDSLIAYVRHMSVQTSRTKTTA